MPALYQSWLKTLFLHWDLLPEQLRPHVPKQLELDTFNGSAWIGITSFVVKNLRAALTPPLPWLSNFHLINVRTYVHCRGIPGIWFMSLQGNSILAMVGARIAYQLPYRQAHIRMLEHGGNIFYSSRRDTPPLAEFSATCRPGEALGRAAPESLEFFLVERYCFYMTYREKVYLSRIFHEPWNLQEAELTDLASTMLTEHGLEKTADRPVLHYSEAQHVAVWPLQELRFT